VRRVGDDLHQLLSIVQQFDRYAREIDTPASNEAAITLHTQIETLTSDLNGFLAIVQPHLCQGTLVTRLMIRLKWLMGLDKRLGQISDRISAQSRGLLLAFALYSRYVRPHFG